MAADKPGRIRLYIDDAQGAEDQLSYIAERARDARPVMKVILGLMSHAQAEQFRSAGARGGTPWQKDTKAWIERKRRQGWNVDTEIYRGDLKNSLTMGSGEMADEIRRYGKHSATFGTNRFYAKFQGHKRVLLYMTVSDMNDYAERMLLWLLDGTT